MGGDNISLRQHSRGIDFFCLRLSRLNDRIPALVRISMRREENEADTRNDTDGMEEPDEHTGGRHDTASLDCSREHGNIHSGDDNEEQEGAQATQTTPAGEETTCWRIHNDAVQGSDLDHYMTIVEIRAIRVGPRETALIPHTRDVNSIRALVGYGNAPYILHVRGHNTSVTQHSPGKSITGNSCMLTFTRQSGSDPALIILREVELSGARQYETPIAHATYADHEVARYLDFLRRSISCEDGEGEPKMSMITAGRTENEETSDTSAETTNTAREETPNTGDTIEEIMEDEEDFNASWGIEHQDDDRQWPSNMIIHMTHPHEAYYEIEPHEVVRIADLDARDIIVFTIRYRGGGSAWVYITDDNCDTAIYTQPRDCICARSARRNTGASARISISRRETDWRPEAPMRNIITERHAEIDETAQEETLTSRTTTEEQGTVDRRWKISNAAPQGMTLTMVEQRSVQLGAGSEAQIPQSYDMQEVYIQVRRNDLSQIAHVGGYNVRIRQDGRMGGSFCFICTRLDDTMRAAVTIGMTHERDRTPSMVETQPTAAERELVDRNLLRQQSWGGGCGSRNWIFRNDTLDIPEHQMTVVTRQIVEVAPGETEHIPHTHNMREVYLLAGYDGNPDIDDVERHNIATVRHTRVGTFFGLKCTRLDDASAAAMTIDIIRQEDTEDGYGEGSEDEEHVLNADPGAFVLHPHRNAHRRQLSAERGHGVGEIQSANVGQEHATDKHSDQRHNTDLTHDLAKDAETTQPLPEGAVGGCACQE